MHNFREMPLVRMFLVALVVLFACGAVVPGGAFARTWMQNGHEGDPSDGVDSIGGGGGDFEGNEDHLLTGEAANSYCKTIWYEEFRHINNEIIFTIIFDGQSLVLIYITDDLLWRQK